MAALVAYLPVIAVPYAFSDDYWILGAAHGFGGENVWKHSAVGGRPIQGALLSGVFAAAPDIDSLRLVRLVGVIGVGLLGLLLQRALRQRGIADWLAAMVAISIIALPSFQVYVSWTVLFSAAYASALAGLAWLRLSSSFALTGRAMHWRRTQAVGLLLCALFIYQPPAMFFWVFAAIDVLSPRQSLARAARRLGAGLVIALAAFAIAYITLRIAVHVYPTAAAGRSSLSRNLTGKLHWFFVQPLPNALSLVALVPRWIFAFATATVALVGIALLHAERRREALGFVGLALVLVPLAYLPNLVVIEEFASYRSLGAMASLLMLYVWFGLWGIARTVRPLSDRQMGRAVAVGAASLLAVFGVVLAARNVTTLFAKSQSLEIHMMRSMLAPDRTGVDPRIVFIKSGVEGPAPLRRYDEFGYPSSYPPWVPVPATLLILHERNQPPPRMLDVLAPDQIATRPPRRRGTLYVDMRKLRRHHIGWTFWTLHAADG